MRRAKGPYTVTCLDVDGFVISQQEEWPALKGAKVDAKFCAGDKELLSAGLYKVEVRDADDNCVFDVFTESKS